MRASSIIGLSLLLLPGCFGYGDLGVSPTGGRVDAPGPASPRPPTVPNPEQPDDPDAPVDPGVPGPTTTRRLTAKEIEYSLSDIYLNGAAFPLPSFVPEGEAHVFDNLDLHLGMSPAVLESLVEAAETVAKQATADLSKLHACDTAALGEETCLRKLVGQYGLRTWRRPLTTAEADALVQDVFVPARANADYRTAVATVIEALIASPHFLFRTELGPTDAAAGSLVQLTPWEMATALAYALWRSAPDDVLLEAARTGQLSDPAHFETQARRMLQDPRARRTLRSFVFQWLELQSADRLAKVDPSFDADVARSMVGEAERFVDHHLWEGDGRLQSLLTSTKTFVNADVASLYGLSGGFTDAFVATDLDPSTRSGVLTQPLFIASHTPPTGFNPIHLGLVVRAKFFCNRLPDPPAGVVTEVDPDPNLSTRQRFQPLVENTACKGCHAMINPVGFGFEQFGVLGKHVTTEPTGAGDVPLTGQGELRGTDRDGAFEGPVELAQKLATSDQVRTCVAAHLLEFALGRSTASPGARVSGDEAALEQVVSSAFADGDLREGLVALVTQPVFYMRHVSSVGGAP